MAHFLELITPPANPVSLAESSGSAVAGPGPRGGLGSDNAIIGAATIAALYLGQALLIPLALAIFLTFLLSPAVNRLGKMHVPRAVAVAVVALSAFLGLVLLTFLIGRQVNSFAEDLPRYKTTLIDKIRTVKDMTAGGGKLEQATETIKSLRKELDAPATTGGAQNTVGQSIPKPAEAPAKPIQVTVETPESPLDQLKQTVGMIAPPLITAGIVILFVVILLFYREDVRDRAIRLLGVHDLERTTRAMNDAGRRLNRYFLTATAINTAFGIVIGAGLWWIGVPNPILWAAIAGLMRFVPFVGVPIAAVLPLLLSVVVDPGWTMLAATAGLFVLSEIFVSQVVETLAHGEATGLSPLAVILATTFWTLLWGPVGLVLAVPMTVMLAVLGRHIERFELFEVLLGAEPALSPADRFYQRILAGHPEEAAEQMQSDIEGSSLTACYDTVVMEALRKATRDTDAGRLDASRLGQIKASVDVFIQAVADAADEDDSEHAGTALTDNKRANGGTSATPIQTAPIICVAARTQLDAAAAALLVQLLDARGIQAMVVTPNELVRGQSNGSRSLNAGLVCLSAFDAGNRSAQVKFLVRRLKRQMPAASILGGFWNLDAANPANGPTLSTMGTDDAVSTFTAAVDRCILHAHGAPVASAPTPSLRAEPVNTPAVPA